MKKLYNVYCLIEYWEGLHQSRFWAWVKLDLSSIVAIVPGSKKPESENFRIVYTTNSRIRLFMDSKAYDAFRNQLDRAGMTFVLNTGEEKSLKV